MPKVVLEVEDDISTDIIYPGRFMATVLPTETPQFAFADQPEFNTKLRAGDFPRGSFIVAGKNFGCGSSREQAASCLKGPEFIVVARDFARIFLQNAINLGLQTVICPTIEAHEGDEMEFSGAEIINKTSGKRFPILPLPQSRQAVVDAGGLIPYARQQLLKAKGR